MRKAYLYNEMEVELKKARIASLIIRSLKKRGGGGKR